MIDRLCFVQFIHPGGEHSPDDGRVKHWNRGPHKRKFLLSPGEYVDEGGARSRDELLFWGEWEAESEVIADFAGRQAFEGPRFLYEPFYSRPAPAGWRQNTDPFVFGECFHYTGCMQHTRIGPTQLRHLARGSVVLFGSCIALTKFVVDTVFVVADHVDHGPADYAQALERRISQTYRAATIEPWYSTELPLERKYRLYFGATRHEPVHGMFSFFPASTLERHPSGFARPRIDLPGLITPHLTQGKRLNPQSRIEDVHALWERVVEQVRAQDLLLGVHAELPPARVIPREPTTADRA